MIVVVTPLWQYGSAGRFVVDDVQRIEEVDGAGPVGAVWIYTTHSEPIRVDPTAQRIEVVA